MEHPTPRPASFLNVHRTSGNPSVEEHLGALVTTATAAVPSLSAVEVVLIRDGYPVVLHAYGCPPAEPGSTSGTDLARTSLRMPFSLLAPGLDVGGYVLFYASVAGALVDLAADAAYILGEDGTVLDADLPPRTQAAGVVGLAELTAIGRAQGVLIERGHDPSEVATILRGQAVEAGLEPHTFAVKLLEDAHGRAPGQTGQSPGTAAGTCVR